MEEAWLIRWDKMRGCSITMRCDKMRGCSITVPIQPYTIYGMAYSPSWTEPPGLVFTGQVRSGHLPKLAVTATSQMTADSKKPWLRLQPVITDQNCDWSWPDRSRPVVTSHLIVNIIPFKTSPRTSKMVKNWLRYKQNNKLSTCWLIFSISGLVVHHVGYTNLIHMVSNI